MVFALPGPVARALWVGDGCAYFPSRRSRILRCITSHLSHSLALYRLCDLFDRYLGVDRIFIIWHYLSRLQGARVLLQLNPRESRLTVITEQAMSSLPGLFPLQV